MESQLVHGEGDREGEPFVLAGHMLRALYRWYEYNPTTGLYLHKKGLIGWPKGQAKTEFEEAVGIEHLAGPSRKTGTPVVIVAAVDGDQAGELVRRAGMMVADQPLASELTVQDTRIIVRGRAARMVAISAAIGKNDGKLTTLQLNDELHEWDGPGTTGGAKRFGVLERNLNKRPQARQLNVTTAGWSLESLAGAMYVYGCKVASGEIVDPGFLMDWWEASAHWDLDDPLQLLEAIREANPVADVFWPAEQLVRGYNEHLLRGAAHEFIRYHLNRWVLSEDELWMDMAVWGQRAAKGPIPSPDTPVVLGFDGSHRNDSTAIVGATVEARPHVFVVDCWERPETATDEWRVPDAAVRARLVQACEFWTVKEIAADVSLWRETLKELELRGLPVVEFPQTNKRMGPACDAFLEAAAREMLTHDGDPRLARHVSNAHRWETGEGIRIAKAHKKSDRKIDLAVAAVMARERAAWWARNGGGAEPVFAY